MNPKLAFHKTAAFCETSYITNPVRPHHVRPHHVQAAAARLSGFIGIAFLTIQRICGAFSQSLFYKFLMSNDFKLSKSVEARSGLWTILWMPLSPVDLHTSIQIVILADTGSSPVRHPIFSTPFWVRNQTTIRDAPPAPRTTRT